MFSDWYSEVSTMQKFCVELQAIALYSVLTTYFSLAQPPPTKGWLRGPDSLWYVWQCLPGISDPFGIYCQEMQHFSLDQRQTMNNMPRIQSKWGAASSKYLERIKVGAFSGNGSVLEADFIRECEDWRQRGKINDRQHWLHCHKHLIIILGEYLLDVLSTTEISIATLVHHWRKHRYLFKMSRMMYFVLLGWYTVFWCICNSRRDKTPIPRRDKTPVQEGHLGTMCSLCLRLSWKLAEQLCGLLRK